MNARVLVVDDDEGLARSLGEVLEAEGFLTRVVLTGEAALSAARSWRPHLVLLEVMLPDTDGLSICRELRKDPSVAIIMVTARSETVDRIVGLEVGADDYIAKPFNVRELVARVRAVLRRTHESAPSETRLVSRDLELQCDTRKAFLKGKPIELARKEFELLKTLMTHQGQAMPREHLYQLVWGGTPAMDSRTLDIHVRLLREKIEQDPANPKRIVTLHGVGYRFQE